MASNIVDKLKLKSGEYYDFKPEGYDELVAKIEELSALIESGVQPDWSKVNSGTESNDSGSNSGSGSSSGSGSGSGSGETPVQPTPTPTPTPTPSASHRGENMAGGELIYLEPKPIVPEPEEPVEPVRNIPSGQVYQVSVSSANGIGLFDGISAMRVYSDGSFRMLTGSADTTVDGNMISGLNEAATGLEINGIAHPFGTVKESVVGTDGRTKICTYTDIDVDEFNVPNDYYIYITYDNGTTSQNSVKFTVPFIYDLSKGTIRVYENGTYRYVQDNETGVPETVGTLFRGLEVTDNTRLGSTKPSKMFDNTESVIDNGVTKSMRYATYHSPTGSYTAFTGTYNSNMRIYENDVVIKTVHMELIHHNSNFEFNVDKITIDRSNHNKLSNQLSYEELYRYIKAVDDEGNGTGYNDKLLNFHIGPYKPGVNRYQGNAVSIINTYSNKCGWKFERCTWEKNAKDTIYVSYGDKLNCASITVEITESNSNDVPLRTFKPVQNSEGFIEGRAYLYDEIFLPVPSDAQITTDRTFWFGGNDLDTKRPTFNDGTKNWNTFKEGLSIRPEKYGQLKCHAGWYGNGNTQGNDLYSGGTDIYMNVKPNVCTFDWEDGDLFVYESGYCRVGNTVTKLLPRTINRETFSLVFDSNEYLFGSDTETINENGQSVSRKFIKIDRHVVPGEYILTVNYDNGLTDTVRLNINDRKFLPKFKVREIRIDRSIEMSFDRQMENNYLGTYMTNSNLITYSLDYFDIPDDCKVDTTSKYLYGQMKIKLNDKLKGSPYEWELIGNAVEIVRLRSSNGQWCFRACTWKKDQTDTVTLLFGNREYDQITVSTYDSSDRVYLRKITDDRFNHKFNVNQEYTLRDMFGFYPVDVTGFPLKMSIFKFSEYDTSALEFKVVGPTPTKWSEFYDDYMRIKVLKAGSFSCFVNFETAGLGGKMRIDITGVTDGSGKPMSASGKLD